MPKLTAFDKFIQQALKYGFSLFGLPKTGQTTEYRTGDDGDFQKGYPKTGSRFTDNGDGTVTDNATGLMWVADPSQIGGVWGTPGSPSTMNWNNAIDRCNALAYAGHSDWRLPNTNELTSILDHGKLTPLIDTDFFPNTKGSRYWTSTTVSYLTSYAIYVAFNIFDATGGNKIAIRYVRPVRGGA